MATGRPRKFNSPDEMQKAIDAYFADCDEKEEPYTITGLAIALDCDRDTLLNYEGRKGYEPFFGTVKRAKAKVQAQVEQKLLSGKVNPTGMIFWLKCNNNWIDKQVHEVNANLQFSIKKPDDLT